MRLLALWLICLTKAFAFDASFLPHGLLDENKVRAFYETRDFAPIWFNEQGQASAHISALQKALTLLPQEALNPNRYHFKLLKTQNFSEGKAFPNWQSFEFLLTDAWLAAASDLSDGLLNPTQFAKTWNAPKTSDEALFARLSLAIAQHDVAHSLRAINGDDPYYQRLKKAYQNEKSDALVLSLERLRWLPNDWFLGDYVMVNVPEFIVRAYHDETQVYETRAIVGTPSRQTPQFIDRMQFVVFSPYWNVPRGIFLHDKLPALKRNPQAFDARYEVLIGESIFPPSAINWHTPEARNYRLRQKPGADNALGRVKFLFPNEHAIYLHDTPNRALFDREKRALSSGCVRLADPLDFASLMLEKDNWTPEGIKNASRANRERWVRLDQSWAIYLLYLTAFVSDNGEVEYFNDIYQLDKKLLNAYKKALTSF